MVNAILTTAVGLLTVPFLKKYFNFLEQEAHNLGNDLRKFFDQKCQPACRRGSENDQGGNGKIKTMRQYH